MGWKEKKNKSLKNVKIVCVAVNCVPAFIDFSFLLIFPVLFHTQTAATAFEKNGGFLIKNIFLCVEKEFILWLFPPSL